MNETQKVQLKSTIRTRMDEISLMLQTEDQVGAANDDSAGLESQISAAVNSQASESALRELRLLRLNVTWLDGEEGGYCEGCGSDIQSERLLALPATRCCVDCAEKREKAQ